MILNLAQWTWKSGLTPFNTSWTQFEKQEQIPTWFFYRVTSISSSLQLVSTQLVIGTRYTNAHQFEKFSAPPLTKVKNPDGSYHNLIYEVHKYFGTNVFNGECVTDHVEDVFKPLAKYLKENNRKAFVAELGGGSSSDSCRKCKLPVSMIYICLQIFERSFPWWLI